MEHIIAVPFRHILNRPGNLMNRTHYAVCEKHTHRSQQDQRNSDNHAAMRIDHLFCRFDVIR